jgi:hypothetical protein
MKKFRASKTINIRADASISAAKLGTIKAGQEIWSDKQETRPGRQEWASVLTPEGMPLGWACIRDNLNRYLTEVPQPAPVVDELPPMPEPAGGLTEYQALAAQVGQLKRDVDLLLRNAGLKA